jgi:5'-3' exonuclease
VDVHLIDATYELFRAFFGAPSALNGQGKEVGAVRGFARSMLYLLRDPRATHVGCAFDHVIRSFRNDLFDGYKTEEGVPPELMAQFELAEEASRALGLVTWPMIEFEADDAMATMADRAARDPRVETIFLCSPDKDLSQCIQGDRIVGVDRMRKTTLNEAGVVAKFGVPPSGIADYLALVGDTADGIPGIKGFGAKSAAAVLGVYGSIEKIPGNVQEWSVKVRGAERLSAALNAERELALLYRLLATLRRDVPLETDVGALEWRGPDEALLKNLAEALGDDELHERAMASFAARGASSG